MVVNEARTGTTILPYHVRAVYESLSGRKAFDGPVETIRDDNKINFQGSLAAGESNTVESHSFSTVLGKNNDIKSDESLVFGEDAVLNDIHRCFYHSWEDMASLKYVRSGKTEAGGGYSTFGTQFPFELKDDTVNNLMITCVGVEAMTDGTNFHGVWKFRALIKNDGFSISLPNPNNKEKEREIRSDYTVTPDVDVKLTTNGIEVKDARSSGNPIFWTCNFDVSELENS